MPVKVRCRGCQKVLNAPDKARGKVIQCPECGTKLKVPAGEGDAPPAPSRPAKAKPKSAADSTDFLAGLNVEQLESEHGEEKVCPYCAADMKDPEDPVCHKCGMNTETGQMDAKEAKKRARKGPDPALFYKAAWSDSWAFLQQHWRLGLRTGLIWTTFLTLSLTSVFMIKVWVFGEGQEPAKIEAPAHPGEEPPAPKSPYQNPGFVFWASMATVFFLGIPGWAWALGMKIIDATMQKEDVKEDRIQFDIFESLAMGVRLISWPAIVMLPLLPVWAGIGYTMGGKDVLEGTSSPDTGLILLAVSYFVVPYLFLPQALVHMSVRHRFKAWILWDQIVVFAANGGATLYWWVVFACLFLPVLVLLTLFALDPVGVLDWSREQMDALAAWLFGFMMNVGNPDARGLFYIVLFTLLIPMIIALAMTPLAMLAGFPAVFMMRVVGLYGFYRRETLGLVTHVSPNQLVGFWVRFLCRAIDYSIIGIFSYLMFAVPDFLVKIEFPLGRYFGAGFMAACNVGFVAIAGSKNARASMASIGLGVIAAATYVYGVNIEIFATVHMALRIILPMVNVGIYYVVNEASTSRSTIGKEAFGVIAQTAGKGAEMTLNNALGRHMGRILCDALVGLPYIMCAFHPRKQALHDVMAKSEVVFRGDK